jgi:hypothetical protein
MRDRSGGIRSGKDIRGTPELKISLLGQSSPLKNRLNFNAKWKGQNTNLKMGGFFLQLAFFFLQISFLNEIEWFFSKRLI